jgi:hypothetical protein
VPSQAWTLPVTPFPIPEADRKGRGSIEKMRIGPGNFSPEPLTTEREPLDSFASRDARRSQASPKPTRVTGIAGPRSDAQLYEVPAVAQPASITAAEEAR